MKIRNLTLFDTGRLRAIAQRVAEDELEPATRKGVTVHFVTRKSRSDDARQARRDAFYRRAVGRVPVGLRYNQAIVRLSPRRIDSAGVALLLAHEFAEMRGLSHDQMRTPRYFFRGNWQDFYKWAEALPLIKAERKPCPTPDMVVERKHAHAVAMLARARTRERRAATIRSKWQARVRYYEKKRAAMQSQ